MTACRNGDLFVIVAFIDSYVRHLLVRAVLGTKDGRSVPDARRADKPMRSRQFTIKATEAVDRGQRMATAPKHACFAPPYLLGAPLQEEHVGPAQ